MEFGLLVEDYIERNGEVPNGELYNLVEDFPGSDVRISKWNYLFPEPDLNELSEIDLDLIVEKREKKDKRKNILNLKSFSQTEINDLELSEGDIIFNSTSKRINVYDGDKFVKL